LHIGDPLAGGICRDYQVSTTQGPLQMSAVAKCSSLALCLHLKSLLVWTPCTVAKKVCWRWLTGLLGTAEDYLVQFRIARQRGWLL